MSNPSPPATPVESAAPAGTAPWRQTLRRLSRNRLAVLGAVLVALTVLPVALAPWLCPLDPAQQRHFLGALPPGSRHPDVWQANHFALGQVPEAPRRLRHARQLTFAMAETTAEEFRVVLRRGSNQVQTITRLQDAARLDQLDLDPAAWEAALLLADGTAQPLAATPPILADQPLPAALAGTGERVLLLRRQPRHSPSVTFTVALDEAGRVTAIAREGAALPTVTLAGPAVRAVLADGRPATVGHLAGTDEAGRDLLARVLHGGRISLLVGIVATLVSLIIGVIYGALSGYAGGATDRVMMAAVDILYAIPFMFLVIILMVTFEQRSIFLLFAALGAVQWLTMARIVRGQVLSLKQKEFVEAARMSGAGPLQIIFRHLLPNTAGPVIVYTTLTVPIVILQESFLAFIGLAVQFRGLTLDSWGALVKQGIAALGATGGNYWLLLAPSLAMVATLLGLNCLGDGLRDALDPRLGER
jgi:oligopeptide transport system permease protein